MGIDAGSETSSKLSRERAERWLVVLQRTALVTVLAGAAGSLGLMLRAGRHQKSQILILLFTIWVLSPFVCFALTNVVSKRWTTLARATLYLVILIVTVASLAIYGVVAFGYTNVKVGFVFLVVPLASWLLIGIVVVMATLVSGRTCNWN
jgi:hypothetical protein